MTEEPRHEVWSEEGRKRIEKIYGDLTEDQRLQLIFGLLEECATLAGDYSTLKLEVEQLRTALAEAISNTSRELEVLREGKDGVIASLRSRVEQLSGKIQELIGWHSSLSMQSDRGQERVRQLTEANRELEKINEKLQKELKKLEQGLVEMEGWGLPEFEKELKQLRDTAQRVPELHERISKADRSIHLLKTELSETKAKSSKMATECDTWRERAETTSAELRRKMKKSMSPKSTMALVALTGVATATGIPIGSWYLDQTSLTRYCSKDTVEGTFYKPDGRLFKPDKEKDRVITGLYHKRKTPDGGNTFITTIDITPPSRRGPIDLQQDCEFRDGELPRLLATHSTGRSSSFYVRVIESQPGSENEDRLWLHFEPSVKPEKLKLKGETTHVGTTVKKGERIVLTVDGEKIITEMILANGDSPSVNVGFLFAADWFSSRTTERLGFSHTTVTNETAFNNMNSVTAPGIDWVEIRKESAGGATQAKDKKNIIKPFYAGVAGLLLLLCGTLLIYWRRIKRDIPPSRHARPEPKSK